MGGVSKDSGFSLVEVMIVLAIGTIALFAFTTMQVNQQKELRSTMQQLARQDLIRVVTGLLSSTDHCSLNLQPANTIDPSDLDYNSVSVSPTNVHKVPLRNLVQVGDPRPVLTNGDFASPLSTSLRLLDVTADRAGLALEIDGPNSAAIVVSYANLPGDRMLAPSRFPVRLRTSGPPTARHILGCAERTATGFSGSFADEVAGTRTFTVPDGVTAIRVSITGGGGAGGGSRAIIPAAWQASAGTGGHGSPLVSGVYPVTPGQVIPYQIGAGGTGVAGENGGDGQESWFGSAGGFMLQAPGGRGGLASPVATGSWVYGPQVAVQRGTGGTLINGFEHQGGMVAAGHCNNVMGGRGGEGPWGGGGSSLGTGYAGAPADGYGSGGSGASSKCVADAQPDPPGAPLAGGNGHSGRVIIEW